MPRKQRPFWSLVAKIAGEACWIWLAYKNEAKIRYIAGICANRFGPERRYAALRLLREALARDIDLETVEKFAKEVGWWAQFRTTIEDCIEDMDRA